MDAKIKIAASGLVLASAYFYFKTRQVAASEIVGKVSEQITDAFSDVVQQTAETIDNWTGGTMKLSAMANVSAATLSNPNVAAFLRVIRRGEGTGDEAGYRRMFGGEMFTSYADHPRKLIVKNGYRSTAAGAYQFIKGTWDETRAIMGLKDFSPAAQDLAALGRIAARGALDDVIAGRFTAAIKKCAPEWASLPFSPYGQPTISMATASSVFAAAGGIAIA